MPLTPKRVLRTSRYAMFFDGVDDYIKFGDVNFFDGERPWSVTIWFKTGSHNGVWHDIIEDGQTTAGIILEIVKRYNSDYIEFIYTNTNGAKGIDYYIPYTPNQWNFLSITFDGANASIYMNAQLIATVAFNGTPASTTEVFTIGGRIYSGRSWDGLIGEVCIYSRVLSYSEILQNYNHPGNPIRDGLVLWLQAHPDYIKDIDNDGILEWVDLSGYGNHGKIYGATLIKLVRDAVAVSTPKRIQSVVR
jgi:hypothetical protein